MTVDEARARVEKIRNLRHDPEAAHAAEDSLYLDIFKAILFDPSNAQLLAAWAIEASLIDFERWCA